LIAFVVPGRLNQLTGGYIYDSHIVAGLKKRGHRLVVRQITRRDAARVLASIPDDAVVIVDGLAGGVLPKEIEREAARLRFVALVHHPLARETGTSKAEAQRLQRSERRTLACARHVVVTSPGTATLLMREYGVRKSRISCIEPGTHRLPFGRLRARPGARRVRVNQLLCVATLTPRKGHVTLVRALARLKHLAWHLTCLGSLERDRKTAKRVRAEIRRAGLESRVSLAGEAASRRRIERHYADADVFVLPTEYEGYGMAVAEAIASGLPVVSTPTGAIAALVGREAGILVPPGNVTALAAALERVLVDANARRRFRAGALRRRKRLQTWPQAVRQMAAVVRKVASG
jgi:glycosyltransferase involved in cell wall biosynthesis